MLLPVIIRFTIKLAYCMKKKGLHFNEDVAYSLGNNRILISDSISTHVAPEPSNSP